ncbi:DUF5753 domain-containing protein [Micromonospora sp. NPDC049257]|uniref:DUF5753 domain-containing protein n=1 Tax=Micromonospora sp. NPDC049257 TaxID=3155771 RepID=UPI00343B4028
MRRAVPAADGPASVARSAPRTGRCGGSRHPVLDSRETLWPPPRPALPGRGERRPRFHDRPRVNDYDTPVRCRSRVDDRRTFPPTGRAPRDQEGERAPSWFLPWQSYEAQATRLRNFEPCLVPGLLQTEDYARAVFSAGGLQRDERVEELLALRMSRQAVLGRDDPPECVFVIDESALRRSIGGPAVMDRQLGRLLEAAELPHVRLHVLPLDAGAHVSLGGGFVLAELPGSEQVLCLDNTARGQIADHPEWIRLMLRKWESLLGEALAERASLDLVNKLKVTP